MNLLCDILNWRHVKNNLEWLLKGKKKKSNQIKYNTKKEKIFYTNISIKIIKNLLKLKYNLKKKKLN
jgi:hypothetical protein